MTRQIDDTVIFEDENYVLVGSDPFVVFNPESHGITPRGVSTGCYRGFVCLYRVRDQVLYLERLGINSADGRYPSIKGRGAAKFKSARSTFFFPNYPFAFHGRVYPFQNFKLSFSGTLRIARGNAKTSVGTRDMGFRDGTEYEQVLDIDLDHGVMVAMRDLSKKIARIRIQHKRIEDLAETGFLLEEDVKKLWNSYGFPRTITIETSFTRGLLEPDPDTLAEKIGAIEREFLTPRRFVALLPQHRNQVFTLDWLASGRVPQHLIDQLRQIVQDGSKEEEVGAWFLQTLLQTPAGKEAHGMASWAVDWHASKVHLTEHARSAVEAVLAGVTPERWPE
jgi:hypothetical protein